MYWLLKSFFSISLKFFSFSLALAVSILMAMYLALGNCQRQRKKARLSMNAKLTYRLVVCLIYGPEIQSVKRWMFACLYEVFCSHNLIQLVITMPTGQVESPADSRADNQPICESASGHSSGSQFNLTAYRPVAQIVRWPDCQSGSWSVH